MAKAELKSLLLSMVVPTILVFIICMVKFIEILFNISFTEYGLIPLNIKGLIGIITAPFIHLDFKHLIGNCVPLFVLTTGLFYFYKDISYQVIVLSWLLTGLMTWLMGREHSVHIGASGIVYALITFHLTSALLRKRKDLTAFSLIVIFLYGSFIWGFFPDFFPERNISWESHLSGAVCGVIIALFYKNEGPQKIIHNWDEEDENNDEDRWWEIQNNT
ncbi:MAG: rhomboid family intramembrane serine protease [Bacteroidales bacterium]|nr:rhomboid family intramembrane serine protease [Bacteroidales bacterium]